VQVRWTVRVPAAAEAGEWRSYYQALADTLTHAFGLPDTLSGAVLQWDRSDHRVTARLHGASAHPDSVEIIARATALPAPRTESAGR